MRLICLLSVLDILNFIVGAERETEQSASVSESCRKTMERRGVQSGSSRSEVTEIDWSAERLFRRSRCNSLTASILSVFVQAP